MKTKQIDLEIERLTMLKNRNELTETGIELLEEIISVKKQLLLHNVINWVAVSDEKPNDSRWVLTSNIVDEWVDRAEYDEEQGYWWNGECEIIPTHWAELPKPPCL